MEIIDKYIKTVHKINELELSNKDCNYKLLQISYFHKNLIYLMVCFLTYGVMLSNYFYTYYFFESMLLLHNVELTGSESLGYLTHLIRENNIDSNSYYLTNIGLCISIYLFIYAKIKSTLFYVNTPPFLLSKKFIYGFPLSLLALFFVLNFNFLVFQFVFVLHQILLLVSLVVHLILVPIALCEIVFFIIRSTKKVYKKDSINFDIQQTNKNIKNFKNEKVDLKSKIINSKECMSYIFSEYFKENEDAEKYMIYKDLISEFKLINDSGYDEEQHLKEMFNKKFESIKINND